MERFAIPPSLCNTVSNLNTVPRTVLYNHQDLVDPTRSRELLGPSRHSPPPAINVAHMPALGLYATASYIERSRTWTATRNQKPDQVDHLSFDPVLPELTPDLSNHLLSNPQTLFIPHRFPNWFFTRIQGCSEPQRSRKFEPRCY
jgi:hypothetical protein